MIIHPRVKATGRTLLVGLSSSLLSASFFFWLVPILTPKLTLISRPVDSFPWWAPVAIKLVESTILSATTLSNAWDAALVGTIGRAPILQLLYSFYSIPWHTILILYILDIASLVVPQYLLASSVPPHTPYDDLRLSSYTSLLSATFLSLPLYYLSAKFLPITLVTYFDAVASVNPLPLPVVILLNTPAGYSLETLLTRYGVKGAIAALANLLVTGTGLIYYGVVGAELKGVLIIGAVWLGSAAISIAATYGFVLRK